jgi:hypothetical protein
MRGDEAYRLLLSGARLKREHWPRGSFIQYRNVEPRGVILAEYGKPPYAGGADFAHDDWKEIEEI